MAVKSKEDLVSAINRQDSTIEIEGDLAKKIIKIKATGDVAWVIALGGIGVALYAILSAPATTTASGGVGVVATSGFVGVAGGTAISVLGVSTATTAIALAVKFKSVSGLNKIRSDYVIERKKENYIILRKSNN